MVWHTLNDLTAQMVQLFDSGITFFSSMPLSKVEINQVGLVDQGKVGGVQMLETVGADS
jgi:hypothetical protein